jgi:apolipoprotein N-acyltransferase
MAAAAALGGVGLWVWSLAEAPSRRMAAIQGGVGVGGASAIILSWAPAAASPFLGPWGGWLAGLGVYLLHAGVGALVGALVYSLRTTLPHPLRAAAGWGVVEWLPGAIPVIGMPFPGVGWALLDTPLAGGLAVFGAAGFGALVALGAGGVQEARSPVHRMAWIGLPLLVWSVAPLFLLPAAPGAGPGAGPGVEGVAGGRLRGAITWHRDRALLQDPEARERAVHDFLEAVLPVAPPGVPLLWPEAPLPGVVAESPAVLAYLQTVQRSGEDTGGAGALAGVHARVGGRDFNTLVRTGTREEAPLGVHRKRYLVAGVERTHLTGAGRPADPGRPGRGLAPGAGALPFQWGDLDVGALLCFEILHPVEVARLRRRGATLLVQATNDAMLSDGARRQHEAMVRLRALEFRIPVLRSALGGEGMAMGEDGVRLHPLETRIVAGREGEELGRVDVFGLPLASSPPPSGWVVPLSGPLAMALLILPLVAEWRRRETLGIRRA